MPYPKIGLTIRVSQITIIHNHASTFKQNRCHFEHENKKLVLLQEDHAAMQKLTTNKSNQLRLKSFS